VDKTRTLLERNEVMEETRNYFQELAKENIIVIGERDLIISDERYVEIEDLATQKEGKLLVNSKRIKHQELMVSKQN